MPAVGTEAGFVTLAYRKNLTAAGLTYTVLESETLTNWQPATPVDELVSDDGAVRVIKAKVPTNGAPKKFLRLEVVEP